MNTVTFKYQDNDDGKTIELSITVGEKIDDFVLAYVGFLMTVGFSEKKILETFSEYGEL